MAKKLAPELIEAAQVSEAEYRIPASISLAQYALESGWGQSMPPGSNNPFGMKCRKGDPCVQVKTREVYNGKSVYITDGFRKFPSLIEAFKEHAILLGTKKVYAKARAKLNGPNPVDNFADALTGVYATDPKYGNLLKQIMKGSNLYQYNNCNNIRRK